MKVEIVIKNGILGQLCMTMEECGELTHACNKYIRAQGYGQTTDVSEKEARERVIEEMAHVQNCIDSLKYLMAISNEEIRKEIRKSDKKCIKMKREGEV